MPKLSREDIQIIANNSNWSEKGIEEALQKEVYPNKSDWSSFLRIFFMSLGVAFTISGIVFFFAYNWADLDKFFKLGLIEVLIIVATLFLVFSKIRTDIKNVILTGVSVLVGVLIAVFGQIYQTGANAYDFFLGWTLFITIWVLVSNFAPLWLLYIILINTTINLYFEQVVNTNSEVLKALCLFLTNLFFLLIALFLKKYVREMKMPIWFTNILALGTIFFSTIGIVYGIFDEMSTTSFYVLLIIALLTYVLGIWFGLKNKSGFYLSIIPFSIIVILSAYFIKLSENAGMFLFITLFVIGGVTLIILNLIDLQKKWKNATK